MPGLQRVSVTVVFSCLGVQTLRARQDFNRLIICAHVLAEHLGQFARQRARILGPKWPPDAVEVAQVQQEA